MKPIQGFEGRYSIYPDGKIIRHYEGKKDIVMSPYFDKATGCYRVKLTAFDGVSEIKYVHLLVAQTFLPNELGFKNVGFKDGDKKNYHADNLYWLSEKTTTLPEWPNTKWVKGYEGRYYTDGCEIYNRDGEKLKGTERLDYIVYTLRKGGKQSQIVGRNYNFLNHLK